MHNMYKKNVLDFDVLCSAALDKWRSSRILPIFFILRALRIGVFLEYLERPSAALISDACTFSSSSISLGLSFMVERTAVC